MNILAFVAKIIQPKNPIPKLAMEIKFQTKEESNLQQEGAFLKLSPSERVWRFFELMQKSKSLLVGQKQPTKSDNFIIHIKL